MLFKEKHLNGIKSGKITLAFRKWQKASVKEGSLLLTSAGLIKIGKIESINENDISDSDALNAGFSDKEEIIKSFPPNSAGTIFKISVAYHSEDPRIKSREKEHLTEKEFSDLKKKLKQLDNYSKQGLWTSKILFAVKDNPNLRAAGIAKLTGFEKEWLKVNIRKLKNLGLTISHTVGYELSPFGKIFIQRLKDEE